MSRQDDLVALDALTDAEADNFRTMRNDGDVPQDAEPTLATTLDSWVQMPDDIAASLAERPEEIAPILERLIAEHGPDHTIKDLYAL